MPALDDLNHALEQVPAGRVLLIGDYFQAALTRRARDLGSTLVAMPMSGAAALASEPLFDLAIVSEFDPALAKAEVHALLAALRDVHARRVLVIAPESIAPDLSALGFTLLAKYSEQATRLFGFELRSYKAKPEWLNAQYWANPEMWDKKRW